MSTAEKIIKIAKAEVGYHEGRSGGSWNNHQKYSPAVPGLEWSQDQPWCCTFCAWVALAAGAGDLYPRTASCDEAGRWFKERDQWSAYPAIGAQVFFGSPSDLTHTGIVCDYDDTWVWSVEGNTNQNGSAQGDGVYINKRARRSDHVVGYGYPAFPEGIVSADPAWSDKAPKPSAPPVKETPYQRVSRIAHQRLVKIKNLTRRLKKAKAKR